MRSLQIYAVLHRSDSVFKKIFPPRMRNQHPFPGGQQIVPLRNSRSEESVDSYPAESGVRRPCSNALVSRSPVGPLTPDSITKALNAVGFADETSRVNLCHISRPSARPTEPTYSDCREPSSSTSFRFSSSHSLWAFAGNLPLRRCRNKHLLFRRQPGSRDVFREECSIEYQPLLTNFRTFCWQPLSLQMPA
jgi:hypothetical protein